MLYSLCENSEIFVGRGFNRDINAAMVTRLQPLKFPACIFALSHWPFCPSSGRMDNESPSEARKGQ